MSARGFVVAFIWAIPGYYYITLNEVSIIIHHNLTNIYQQSDISADSTMAVPANKQDQTKAPFKDAPKPAAKPPLGTLTL